MRVVVPFGTRDPKTRLDPVLSADERMAFARVMLKDVLAALGATPAKPEVLATADFDLEDVPVTVDDRPLTDAVNALLAVASDPVAVVMADLPLATPTALTRLLETPGDVVLAPGRAGGTNALVTRHPDFRTDYHDTSYLDHLDRAHDLGASVRVVDSYRLSTDVDEPDDLLEVLIHGEGDAATWLRDHGVRIDRSGPRADVVRER